jgi:hypothetical protein
MRFVIEGKRTGPPVRKPLLSLSSFLLAIAVGIISSFTFSTMFDMARMKLYGPGQAVQGLWHGQWHGVHAVTIRVERNGDALSGTARFSRVVVTRDGPKVVGESGTLSLINPKLKGDSLSFEVQSPEEMYPAITTIMEMRFTNEGEAELRRISGQQEDEVLPIAMSKERSF